MPATIKGAGKVWKGRYVYDLGVDSSELIDDTPVFELEIDGKTVMLDREGVIRLMARQTEWLVKTNPRKPS